MRPIFCLSGTCSLTTIGMGRINRITSEMMFAAAVAMYSAAELMQEPVVIVMSKLLSIGSHAKIRLKKMPVVYPITRPSVAKIE